MAPASTRKGVLANILETRKNTYNYQSSHEYHSFLFCCDRFRDVFKLPHFSCHDFDVALNLESENFRSGSKGLTYSDLIQKLVITLCRPWGRPTVGLSNYNECIYYVLERRYVNETRPNFMGTVEDANIHALPSEVKIWLLNYLLELRIGKDDSETVDLFCDPTALRVLELGSDSFLNNYYYFGEFRVVVELVNRHAYHHVVDDLNHKNALWKVLYDSITEQSRFLIAAETVEQWTALVEALDLGGPNERVVSKGVKNLEQHELQAHLIEMARLEELKQEEQKTSKKTEVKMMKELGLVRSSGRLQVKEIEKRQKEEEERKAKDEQLKKEMEAAIANGTFMKQDAAQKAKSRAERHQHREAVIAMSMLSNPIFFNLPPEDNASIPNKEEGELEENGENTEDQLAQPHDMPHNSGIAHDHTYEKPSLPNGIYSRQAEDAEAVAFLCELRQEPRVEKSPDENKFTPPILANGFPLVSRLKRRTNDSDQGSPDSKKKRVSFAEYQPTRAEGLPVYQPLPYTRRIEELHEYSIREYYSLFGPSKVKITQKEYSTTLKTALVLFHNEFLQTQTNLWSRDETWPELEQMLSRLRREMLESRIELVMELEALVTSISGSETRSSLIKGMLLFADMSWDPLFLNPSKEDSSAKEILRHLLDTVSHLESQNPIV